MTISKIWALEILDSRGFPTLKTYVTLEDGSTGWAAIPSGASTGSHEAHELRDGDTHRYAGQGVLKAKYNVENVLQTLLVGQDAFDQEKIDQKMIHEDGTPNKARLGANAILSVSLAVARAAAVSRKLELYQYLAHFFNTNSIVLPVPMINVINGGKHAPGSSDIQEYVLMPYGFSKFSESLRAADEVFHKLKGLISARGFATTVGDEGGFAPKLGSNTEPLSLLVEAISEAGYVPGTEFGLGIDSAASEFFKDGQYHLQAENKSLSRDELTDYYVKMAEKFPLCSLEDHFAEDDWQGFVNLNKLLGQKVQTVGDDLYVTNVERLKKGIGLQATNAILIKVNQIGTLSETIQAIKLAKESQMQVVVSHRSGETEDSFIADLVVGAGLGQIKTGSLSRSERLAKYNRLLEIEAREKELDPDHLFYYDFPYKLNGNGY
ncbi:phosphopyruvate hydratase [Candidatus Roizmanbacteria bacterium RIFOXYB2_FULL_41_10]|uniref:Enolase n=1 Tax=Candidatus Roizmanbacteria bacterium RIFOXYA1_FULL_41_12 TaxID=1802082 RepID=A0A1F7KEF9_9BACT|nr:MAG: phosphopyruvate hydratase [Candidatus Roizmanbacteria bacterium RIFOXYA1_FULL_41_12]OGK67383.1 MAG: phosphopyruvate hydratase [Candidatus Roizmanbacteria bacterium RIFOXYB1_FULL_41_27]OGK68093.1 MAG: phosphopyruvate hydratase [Candidatus Roizmanbacteria bacterium RIFOXYA2_FULL_41_8]OGK71167.1 MAG: phosphopyruvate hydratase [Candidatus Roizmanbacteria bacterium RIFOXYB2_FULL_41_10]OGK71618.1 MAG: phosphopyruvate hydratase [Candidatus Roizmanbacteria bacterium RIFOXYC1_FULL_41_16]